MKTTEMRDLSAEDLVGKEKEIRAQLFELRLRHNTGVLDSTADLPKLKKDLARVLTVKNELQRQINPDKKRKTKR